MAIIELDQVVRQSGNRTDGFINIAQKADYTWFQIPVIILEGTRPGPVLLLEGCTHGDEQEGCEAILETAKKLENSDFAGTVVCVPVLNTEAFSQFSRSTITDGLNFNRSYPGNKTSYISNRILAEYVEKVFTKINFAINFHGGGQVLHLEPIISYVPGDSKMAKTSQKMAQAFNLKYQWQSRNLPFGGFVKTVLNEMGIPSILPELGSQCGRLYDRQKNIQLAVDGIRNVMAYLDMIPKVEFEPVEKTHVTLHYIHSHNGGIHKIVKQPNEFVKEGETLNLIEDIFGNVIEEVKAPFDGIVNGFWSVPVIRPGDWSSLFMKVL